MNVNNEQMGAIYQQLQQSEHRLDHKASGERLVELTVRPWEIQCCGKTDGRPDSNWGRRHSSILKCIWKQGTFQKKISVVNELVEKRNKELKIPAMDTSSKPKFDLSQYNASTPIVHNKLSALGLFPISYQAIKRTNSVECKFGVFTKRLKYYVRALCQDSPMLAAVPTTSIIPVESMTNPPPTLITPIMTRSSAPGAQTGLPQQQADSTERSRKGQRKRKESGISYSPDSSVEREYTQRQENSAARNMSWRPQLPKMQIFKRRGSMTWEAFRYQLNGLPVEDNGKTGHKCVVSLIAWLMLPRSTLAK